MSDIKIHRNLSSIDLKMIVAADASGGIGNKGELPWPPHKEDFARFKKLTMGAVVVMGRKTFEEIEKIRQQKAPDSQELLPGRTCVVISSRKISTNFNISVVKSLLDAVKYHYEESKSIYILGGLQLFIEALPYIRTLHLTMFNQYFECDRFLPLPYIAKHFNIVEGTVGEDGSTKFLTCQRVTL